MNTNELSQPSRPLSHMDCFRLFVLDEPKTLLDFASEEEAMKLGEVQVTVQPFLVIPKDGEIDEGIDEDLLELPLEFSPIKLPPPPSRPQTPEQDPNDTKFGTSAKPILYLDNDDGNKGTLIQVGGFGKLSGRWNLKPYQLPAPFSPGFPPPSNDHYHLTTNGRLPEDLNEKGSYFRAGYICSLSVPSALTQTNGIEEQLSANLLSMAADINTLHTSKTMDIPQTTSKTLTPSAYKSNILDPKALDAAYPQSPNDFCRKCKQFHIHPGEPDTLPDRDTCGSYIPDWHYPVDPDQPWVGFAKVFSVLLEWVDQDFGFDNSTGSKSFYVDMAYHSEHRKWRETIHPIGGGIWLCRSVHGAPQAERTCGKCHMPMLDPTMLEGPLGKKLVIEWVHYMLKYLGLSDVEMARAIVHRMGNTKIGELVHDVMTPAWKWEHFAEFEAYYEKKAWEDASTA